MQVKSIDLPQVDLTSFRVEYLSERSELRELRTFLKVSEVPGELEPKFLSVSFEGKRPTYPIRPFKSVRKLSHACLAVWLKHYTNANVVLPVVF